MDLIRNVSTPRFYYECVKHAMVTLFGSILPLCFPLPFVNTNITNSIISNDYLIKYFSSWKLLKNCLFFHRTNCWPNWKPRSLSLQLAKRKKWVLKTTPNESNSKNANTHSITQTVILSGIWTKTEKVIFDHIALRSNGCACCYIKITFLSPPAIYINYNTLSWLIQENPLASTTVYD